MREYKIIKSDLGRNIYKRKEESWKISVRFLGGKDNWILNKDHARTFYHREDAEWALVIMKRKDEQKSD